MRPPSTFTAGQRRVARLRLASQRLDGAAAPERPLDAVSWMLAMQGQDLPGVMWAIGLRVAGATQPAVAASFDSGEIVRSWALRGTLHVIAAADLPWILALTGTRTLASLAGRRRELGLTDVEIDRARAVVGQATAGGRAMTRADVLATIDAAGISTTAQRGYHLLYALALAGEIGLGPMIGREQAFVGLDQWIRDARRLDRDEALGELARRYLQSHGPATAHDIARWSGLPLTDARRGIEIAAASLATIDIEGTTYHLAGTTLDAGPPPVRARLLPGFDEYLLGYRDRSTVLAPDRADVIVPGGNGVFRPTLVVDGAVMGTWSRRLARRHVNIDVEAFGPLGRDVEADVDIAAAAYGTYLGLASRRTVRGS